MSVPAFVALGSNLGDMRANLEHAINGLRKRRVAITHISSFYETAPQSVTDQPWFLNAVACIDTDFTAQELLQLLQETESEVGRDRSDEVRFGPRVIDLDLLLYGNQQIETSALIVPHPRMNVRRFVLEPLVEIAPELRHPATGRLFRKLLEDVQDQEIRRLVL